MTRWKIYGTYFSLSAEQTVTGSIYVGRAAAVCVAALSGEIVNSVILPKKKNRLFSSNKSRLKAPERLAVRSLKRFRRRQVILFSLIA